MPTLNFNIILVSDSICIEFYLFFFKTSITFKNHSVMQKEVVSVLKSVAVVVAGVLLANYVERKYLSSKVEMPTAN